MVRGPRNILPDNGVGGNDGVSEPDNNSSNTTITAQKPTKPAKPVKTQKPKSVRINSVQGIVKSITVSQDGSSRIGRLFGTISGRNYTKNGTINIIQIDLLNSSQSCQVILLGDILSGSIISGNTITAEGKFDSYNRFVAKSIVNDTTGSSVPVSGVISSSIVVFAFILTIAIVSVLVLSGTIVTVLGLLASLLGAALCVVAVFYIIKFMLLRRW